MCDVGGGEIVFEQNAAGYFFDDARLRRVLIVDVILVFLFLEECGKCVHERCLACALCAYDVDVRWEWHTRWVIHSFEG